MIPSRTKHLAKITAFLVGFLPAVASAQQFPQTLSANTVLGRTGIGSGPVQAIPFAQLSAQLGGIFGAVTANQVYAGPTSGGAATAAFRALVGADLPVPGASSLGGVQSLACGSHNWFSALSTLGVFTCSQPAFSDISGTATGSQLPNPSASTLGGVQSKVAVTHQFLNTISTSGVPGAAQPACTDLSDATSCNAARGQLPGETSTGSASSGNLGEYVESVVLSGAAVSVTTATAKTIAQITLTAGDWDVDGLTNLLTATSTSVTQWGGSISGTTNTLDTTAGKYVTFAGAAFVPGLSTTLSAPIAPYRMSVSGSTTVYLVALSTFTASTMTAYGIIRARRVR